MAVIFRTNDATKWGTGKGANLAPVEVDENFWELLQGLTFLQDNPPVAVSIDHFAITGQDMYVYMTDNSVLGPYTVPMAQWKARGEWQPNTPYDQFDVVAMNGACYLVMIAHISAPSFDPGASAGSGLDYYGLIMEAPGNVLPFGGTTGQVLAKIDDVDFNIEWIDPPSGSLPSGGGGSTSYDLAFYVPDKLPDTSTVLFQFVAARTLICAPQMGQSLAMMKTPPSVAAQIITVYVDSVFLGEWEFAAGETMGAGDGNLTDTTISPGSVITVEGPDQPDPDGGGLSVTLTFSEA